MSSVNFSSGLPETILPPDPLEGALDDTTSDDELSALVGRHPRSTFGWAALGERATDPMVRYAFFRVGYHRGLDALRGAGWRGSGFVRGSHPSNRGFLRCVDGLLGAADAIGERDEVERCTQFLAQLDPDWTRR